MTKQIKKWKKQLKKSVEDDYDLLAKSCIDVASDALKAAKFNPGYMRHAVIPGRYNPPTMSPIPNSRFSDIVVNNPMGNLFSFPNFASGEKSKNTVTIGTLSEGTIVE